MIRSMELLARGNTEAMIDKSHLSEPDPADLSMSSQKILSPCLCIMTSRSIPMFCSVAENNAIAN